MNEKYLQFKEQKQMLEHIKKLLDDCKKLDKEYEKERGKGNGMLHLGVDTVCFDLHHIEKTTEYLLDEVSTMREQMRAAVKRVTGK